jgi:branched-chain amino acid transport system permease protein
VTELINTVLQGILIGGLYALIAAGLSLAFGIMRIVNLAHGDFVVLAAFLAFSLATWAGVPAIATLFLVPPVMAAFGYVLQRGLLNQTMGGEILPPLLVTFGLSIILQNGLQQLLTADSRKLALGGFETASLKLGEDIAIGWYGFAVLVLAGFVIGGLKLVSDRTALGRAFRATSDDPETAAMTGIKTAHVFALAMALSLALCGIAGVALAVWTSFTPVTGPSRLLVAFEVVVIGGLGSIWGALAGGIVLGVAQAIGGYFNPSWLTLAGHIAFIAVLVARPGGLLRRAAT